MPGSPELAVVTALIVSTGAAVEAQSTGRHEVYYAVSNVEAVAEWYRLALGFDVAWLGSSTESVAAKLTYGEAELRLVQAVQGDSDVSGVSGLGLFVDDIVAVDSTARANAPNSVLRSLSPGPESAEPDGWPGLSMEFRDPTGLKVQVLSKGDGGGPVEARARWYSATVAVPHLESAVEWYLGQGYRLAGLRGDRTVLRRGTFHLELEPTETVRPRSAPFRGVVEIRVDAHLSEQDCMASTTPHGFVMWRCGFRRGF